jgi:hypothetical protein
MYAQQTGIAAPKTKIIRIPIRIVFRQRDLTIILALGTRGGRTAFQQESVNMLCALHLASRERTCAGPRRNLGDTAFSQTSQKSAPAPASRISSTRPVLSIPQAVCTSGLSADAVSLAAAFHASLDSAAMTSPHVPIATLVQPARGAGMSPRAQRTSISVCNAAITYFTCPQRCAKAYKYFFVDISTPKMEHMNH